MYHNSRDFHVKEKQLFAIFGFPRNQNNTMGSCLAGCPALQPLLAICAGWYFSEMLGHSLGLATHRQNNTQVFAGHLVACLTLLSE